MPIKKKIFLITALLYILYTIFPLFADTFRVPVWLPSMAVVLVMLVLYPNAFTNNTFYWFLAYAIVLGIYVVFHRPLTIGIGTVQDSKKFFIEIAYILPTISIFSILCYLKDVELTRKLVNWSIAILFVSFISVVPLMLRYNSLREAMSERSENIIIPGLPGYSLMHSYALFLPTLCYSFKVNKGNKKWRTLAGIIVLCFVIYDTFVTTSLVVMLAILIISILYDSKRTNLFWLMLFIVAFITLILYKIGFFVSLIDWCMPWFKGTPVEPKLSDFKKSMLEGAWTGGSIVGRQSFHDISWNSFFQNPFFGTSIVGGHSVLIDRLGGMGLVAGLPFIMIIVSFVKRIVKFYQTKTARFFYWMGVIAGMVYLYQKGLWGCESWLMYTVLMPMGILTIENKVNNNGTKTT